MNPFDGMPRPAPARIRRATLGGKEIIVKAAEERTMRIKLNVDYTVYLDGIHASMFVAGQEADVPERIAAVLLQDRRASLPVEAKAIEEAPENKMLAGSPENKSIFKRGGRRK